MANLKVYSSTTSSLTVYIENLDIAYWNNYNTSNLPRHIKYLISCNGVEKEVIKDVDNEGESKSATFSGLSTDTAYTVTAKVTYLTPVNTEDVSIFSNVFYTNKTNSKPSKFSWDTPKAKDMPFSITSNEWNRLIDKTKEFHNYVNGIYNETTYPMQYVEQGGIFYADRFNEVRYAIGSLYSTGIQDKVRGDQVTAADLNKIVESLNSI